MTELDDIALLREYAANNSEEAFATLVSRHVNKVYSVALRHTGNSHQAEEITQAVFVILARKARQLGAGVVLSGWLYHTARLTAMTFIRSEIRRARREQEAHMQTVLKENAADPWPQIAPLLDAAMAGLNETDRNAVVLRYFDDKSMKEIGAAIGVTEDAAKMRLSRAVSRLQKFFFKRGVTSTAQTLAESIAAHSVQTAPAALAKTVTAVALAKGVATSASTLTLIKGALKVMAWTKTKTAIVAGVVALAAVGTTTVVLKAWFFRPSVEDVFIHYDNGSYLKHAPPVMLLRPTQYAGRLSWINGNDNDSRILGRNRPMAWVLAAAYDVGPERMILPPDLPTGTFDYLITESTNTRAALRDEIKKQFGLAAHVEMRKTNVLVLKVADGGVRNLKINRNTGNESFLIEDQKVTVGDSSMQSLAANLGGYFLSKPVVDETGLTNHYDAVLRWKGELGDADTISGLLQNEMGLELVPAQRDDVKMLVVEYADGPSDYAPRAGSDLQGYWKGTELWGPSPWPVILKITEPSTGQFRAMFRNAWFNPTFALASSVTYNPPNVRVEFPNPDRIIEGEINSSHTEIRGTLRYTGTNFSGQASTGYAVTVTLTDPKTEAALEAQKDYQSTGTNDLVGHWTATAGDDSPGLNIARLPDGKLSAELGFPGWPNGIEDTHLQTNPELRIVWGYGRIATFQGHMENGKLVGTLKENRKGKPQPITFLRSEN